jgi:hypothetical protein
VLLRFEIELNQSIVHSIYLFKPSQSLPLLLQLNLHCSFEVLALVYFRMRVAPQSGHTRRNKAEIIIWIQHVTFLSLLQIVDKQFPIHFDKRDKGASPVICRPDFSLSFEPELSHRLIVLSMSVDVVRDFFHLFICPQ